MTGADKEPVEQSNGEESAPAAVVKLETGAGDEPVEQSNGANKPAAVVKLETGAGDAPSSLDLEIIRQIEYYFGDINLPRDKFLQEQMKLEDGWVPLEVLTKFHRLAKLSSDTAVIAAALAKSTSGLLEISEDGKKLRRNPEQPLPELNEERRKELTSRSVYVKGFPREATVDVCLKFFEDHPLVENVVMRRYQDRETKKWIFKGSVFATFKTKEQAEKFIASEGLKYEETPLVLKWQEAYLKEKHEEYNTRKAKKSNKQKDQKEPEKTEDNSIKLPAGAVMHFTGAKEGMSREQIKEALAETGGEVAYIDFNKGDTEGWVRLQTENTAKPLFEKLTDGKLKVNEVELTFKALEGDEEKAFLDKTIQEMINRRSNANKNRHHHNKGKHHNRHGGGRKRKQGPHSDAPTEKVKAAE